MKLTIKMEKINIEGLEVAVRSGKDKMFEFNLGKYEEGQTELDFEMELGEIATYFGAMMSTINSRRGYTTTSSDDFESGLSPEMKKSIEEFDKEHAERQKELDDLKKKFDVEMKKATSMLGHEPDEETTDPAL